MSGDDLGCARSVVRAAAGGSDAADSVTLDYDARFLRRKRLRTDAGAYLLLDLAETTSLNDGDVLLLDGGPRVVIRAAEEPLLQVTGADLARLASASADGTIKIWDPATGAELCTLADHGGQVNCIHWSPDGLKLLSASRDNTVRIWDATRAYEREQTRDSSLSRQPE